MENNSSTGVTILDMINSAGFQPGDISHTHNYEDMIQNMVTIMRGKAGNGVEQISESKVK
jgi:hypothetical protein